MYYDYRTYGTELMFYQFVDVCNYTLLNSSNKILLSYFT